MSDYKQLVVSAIIALMLTVGLVVWGYTIVDANRISAEIRSGVTK